MTVRTVRRGFGIVLFTMLLASGGWVLAHPYAVSDWLRLRNYQPPAAISAIAEKDTMTDVSKHLFYLNRPQIEDKATFARACPRADEQTIVIGCYLGGQRGIHVLEVTDDRLQGIEEVTAAHEMLHAAYDRLSDQERKRVDAMLQSYADNGLQDGRIKNILASYMKTEPGQQYNEMHSIFGTEVSNLPDDLEAYYARYFRQRSVVTGFAAHYQEAFTSRQAKVKQYDSQLDSLNKQIKAATDSLETQDKLITSMRQEMDKYRADGNTEKYNEAVAPFNQKIDAYNALLSKTKAMIEQYNKLVAERNEVADQTAQLQQAINSNELPASR